MHGTTTAISPETRLAGIRLTGTGTFPAGVERSLPCGLFGLIAALRAPNFDCVPHLVSPQEIR